MGLSSGWFEGDVEEGLQGGVGVGADVNDWTGWIVLHVHLVVVVFDVIVGHFFGSKKTSFYESTCSDATVSAFFSCGVSHDHFSKLNFLLFPKKCLCFKNCSWKTLPE